jgi:hypothetical protein
MTEKYDWKDEDLEFWLCGSCLHWNKNHTCAAFPEGIPDEILNMETKHDKPYPGDSGIQYEPVKK